MIHDNGQDAIDDAEWLAIEPRLIDAALHRLTARQARLWSLVLDARSLPCQLQELAGEWSLRVPPLHFDKACHELRSFVTENRNWPPVAPPSLPLFENSLATLSVLLLLASFYNISNLDLQPVTGLPLNFLVAGSAAADRIIAGEWWRLITALTLHRDLPHLCSNLAIGGIFVYLLGRELGSGLTWTLLLIAGASGNALNAFFQAESHVSIGASTAVFSAVGVLTALSLVRFHHYRQRRWGLPVAAALALLAILGTEGRQTDLGAHFFGFISGMTLGLISEFLMGRYGRPGTLLNALLAVLSGLLVLVAWLAAMAA